MTDSRLFVSSCSRRQLARRRPVRRAVAGRPGAHGPWSESVRRGRLGGRAVPTRWVLAVVVIAVAVIAFLAGYGGL